jgi:hypothetical protein
MNFIIHYCTCPIGTKAVEPLIWSICLHRLILSYRWFLADLPPHVAVRGHRGTTGRMIMFHLTLRFGRKTRRSFNFSCCGTRLGQGEG